jgi:hypothetical protein
VIGVFQLARERVAPLPQAFDLPLEVVRTVTHGASLLQSPTPVLKTAGNFERGAASARRNPPDEDAAVFAGEVSAVFAFLRRGDLGFPGKRAHTVRLQRNAYTRDRVRQTSRN